IGGLIKPSSGEIYKNGELLNDIPPEKRNMAYLPQTSDYSLFPYMNVWENTVFSPRMKREKDSEEISILGGEILDMVNLRHRFNAFPFELSGGMKQRVALGRAIAADADIFLFDEPLRALDARLRLNLQTELRKLVTDLNKTTFHVTHDQEEAIAVADKVLIINQGQIIQFDTPSDLYDEPNSLFSSYFFGETNLIPVKFSIPNSSFFVGDSDLRIMIDCDLRNVQGSANGKIIEQIAAIKAEKISIQQKQNQHQNKKHLGEIKNIFSGQITQTFYLGKWANLIVNIEEFPRDLTVSIPSSELSKFEIGMDIILHIPPDSISCFYEPWESIKRLEVE
ncbi:MAG: ABC transporter ATP-binding protein, partial [Candidatus Hodarchaeales archaeon]